MMEQDKPAVVQARDVATEAEEASSRGNLEEAVAKYRRASELFTQASRQTTDMQSVMALNLLAQTHRQKADELQLYVEAIMASGNASEEGNVRLEESYFGASSEFDSQVSFGERLLAQPEGPVDSVSWGGEDSMVYARSSSPLAGGSGGPPIYFVFTKNRQGEDGEEQEGNEEVSFPKDEDSDDESAAEESDGLSGAWHMMVKGMEQLLDILPRPMLGTTADRQSDARAGGSDDGPRRKLLSYADREQDGQKGSPLPIEKEGNHFEDSDDDDMSDLTRSVASSFFLVPKPDSPPRSNSMTSLSPSSMPVGGTPRIISPIPRSAASCPAFPAKVTAPTRIPQAHPPRSLPLPFISSSFPPSPSSPEPTVQKSSKPASQPVLKDSDSGVQDEVVRLRNIVAALTDENEKLKKKLEKEEVGNLKKENEILKHSILRFRTEFSKQTQNMRRHKLQAAQRPTHQIHHSLRLSRKPTESNSEFNPLSYSSTTPTTLQTSRVLSPRGSTPPVQPLVPPHSELSPKNLELAFKNLAAKYERQLREMADECAHYKALLRNCDNKIKFLSDENARHLKTIRAYDTKWKKLEQSARHKLQQKKDSKNASPSDSVEFPAGTSPSSLLSKAV